MIDKASYRRHGTKKFLRKPGLEIHVSRLVLFPGTDQQVDTVEIREWNTEAEIYGHGIVVPATNLPDLLNALEEVGA